MVKLRNWATIVEASLEILVKLRNLIHEHKLTDRNLKKYSEKTNTELLGISTPTLNKWKDNKKEIIPDKENALSLAEVINHANQEIRKYRPEQPYTLSQVFASIWAKSCSKIEKTKEFDPVYFKLPPLHQILGAEENPADIVILITSQLRSYLKNLRDHVRFEKEKEKKDKIDEARIMIREKYSDLLKDMVTQLIKNEESFRAEIKDGLFENHLFKNIDLSKSEKEEVNVLIRDLPSPITLLALDSKDLKKFKESFETKGI